MSAEVFVSNPGEGTLVGGRGPLVRMFGEISGGWTLLEGGAPPNTDGPPRHVHHSHGESFYVLEGTLTIVLPDSEIEVPAGGYAYVPPSSPEEAREVVARYDSEFA